MKEQMQKLIAEFAAKAHEINEAWEKADSQLHDDLADDYPFNKSFDELTSEIHAWAETINEK